MRNLLKTPQLWWIACKLVRFSWVPYKNKACPNIDKIHEYKLLVVAGAYVLALLQGIGDQMLWKPQGGYYMWNAL